MIYDLKTGEIYQAVLYQDKDDVILHAEHGESHIQMWEFQEPVLWPEEQNFCAWMRRFQSYDDVADIISPSHKTRIADRRRQIANYAAGNGGQIRVHIEREKPKSGMAKWFGR